MVTPYLILDSHQGSPLGLLQQPWACLPAINHTVLTDWLASLVVTPYLILNSHQGSPLSLLQETWAGSPACCQYFQQAASHLWKYHLNIIYPFFLCVSYPGWIWNQLGLWIQIQKGKMTNQKKKKLGSFMFKWDKRSLWRVGDFWSLQILHGDHIKMAICDQLKWYFLLLKIFFCHQNPGLNTDSGTNKPGSGLGFNEHR